jgi:hypothetical protein
VAHRETVSETTLALKRSIKQWKNRISEKPKNMPLSAPHQIQMIYVVLPKHAINSTPDNTTRAMTDAAQKTDSISDNLQNT